MLDPQRQKQLGEWGFNSIRLGAMWSGFEPNEGQVYVLPIEKILHTKFTSFR